MASSSSSLPNAYNHHHPLEEEDDDDVEGEEEDWLELGLGLSVVREKNELRSNSGSTSTFRSGSSTPIPRTRFGLGLGIQNEGLGVGMEGCNGGNLSVALPSNYHGCLWNHNYHHHMSSSSSSSSSSSWAWPMNNNIGGFLHRQNNLLLPVPRRHYYSRRPESAGLWFNLRSSSSHNREKGAGDENHDEDDLPQIPKAYVRVKDEEDVTVFMVKTYLVTKLGLSNAAQIEISCMGEKLVHSQSLKYVRDVVWLPRLFESVKAIGSIENTSTNHYLMLLHYRRS